MKKIFKLMAFSVLLGISGMAVPNVQPACAADGGETDPLRDGPDTGSSGTGTIAAQTCDTQVWRTMEARARLETEREMMQNQNLIFKPDSILNYVCFDSFASHASMSVGPLFTHTTYFNGKEIIPWGNSGKSKGMDTAMEEVVIASMNPYIQSNYNHNLLGGRGAELGLSQPQIKNIGNKGSTYICSTMSQVWAAAKCMNFLHTEKFANNDGFFPFLNLKAESGGESVSGYETKNEVRQYPNPCTGATPITGSTWKDMYRLSRNEEDFGKVDKLYQYGTPLNKTYTDVRKLIEPGQCGKQAIKTGVKVILSPGSSTQTMEDGVCTNPGCVVLNGTCVSNAAATAKDYGGVR